METKERTEMTATATIATMDQSDYEDHMTTTRPDLCESCIEFTAINTNYRGAEQAATDDDGLCDECR